ncbi:MAG: hypothetical protein ACREUY_04610 [Burkholderiales bacterium]
MKRKKGDWPMASPAAVLAKQKSETKAIIWLNRQTVVRIGSSLVGGGFLGATIGGGIGTLVGVTAGFLFSLAVIFTIPAVEDSTVPAHKK